MSWCEGPFSSFSYAINYKLSCRIADVFSSVCGYGSFTRPSMENDRCWLQPYGGTLRCVGAALFLIFQCYYEDQKTHWHWWPSRLVHEAITNTQDIIFVNSVATGSCKIHSTSSREWVKMIPCMNYILCKTFHLTLKPLEVLFAENQPHLCLTFLFFFKWTKCVPFLINLEFSHFNFEPVHT